MLSMRLNEKNELQSDEPRHVMLCATTKPDTGEKDSRPPRSLGLELVARCPATCGFPMLIPRPCSGNDAMNPICQLE